MSILIIIKLGYIERIGTVSILNVKIMVVYRDVMHHEYPCHYKGRIGTVSILITIKIG